MRKILIILPIIIGIIVGYIIFSKFFSNNEKTYMLKEFRTNDAILRVYGTEYIPNKPGKVFIQLLDNNYRPIDDAVCFLSIYYPDLRVFVEDVIMTKFKRGFYFYDFITPEIEGVYMIHVECMYRFNETRVFPLNFTTTTISFRTGEDELSFLYENNNLYFSPRATTSGGNVVFWFPTLTNVSTFYVYIEGLLDITGGTPATNYVLIQAFNRCTNTYVNIINYTYYMTSASAMLNATCFNPLMLRYYFVPNTVHLMTDVLNIVYYTNASLIIGNIRGSGEIHITRYVFGIDVEQPPSIRIIN